MAFYDEESSNEEDSTSHFREKNGSDGDPQPQHCNGRVFTSNDRINRENVEQKFVNGCEGSGQHTTKIARIQVMSIQVLRELLIILEIRNLKLNGVKETICHSPRL